MLRFMGVPGRRQMGRSIWFYAPRHFPVCVELYTHIPHPSEQV